MKPLIGLTLEGLRQVAAEAGLPRFAAGQMARWLYQKRVTSIDQMTDLPKTGRARLAENYEIGREEPLAEAISRDGTKKYLFRGANGRAIESVMIPDKERATLCVSSQAGCKMNCKFCMTGRQGFHGNLTAAQIINQVLSIPDAERLTNIVFMGMGEPLDNLDNVLTAIEILTAPWGLAWSPKRITVSTIGKLPELERLIRETNVHVALSLHSPYPTEREGLMPVERAFHTSQVLDTLRLGDFAHQRRLSIEYILWGGLNDDLRHADALARLLRGLPARVNLIPYHELPNASAPQTGSTPSDFSRNQSTSVDSLAKPLKASPRATMEAFRDRLNSHGITATIRASRGQDIDAACGLLAGKQSS
ncbi:MAG: 23S rRNA (adenine(2503)-C(2))-methyltransferase RlmN [Bacteroidales bacterium]|nr:23S rRNA (adenine(2503)-C(2))-methyltransferase RlmN [Bacteroidales bacterium]